MTLASLLPSLSSAYARLIEERFGMRLLDSQIPDLNRMVLEMLPESGQADPGALHDALAAGLLPGMLDRLGGRLAIGETHFFRVMPQIQALRNTILPDLIARHTVDRRLRVWSAGCSTGEEAYTLAMLIREHIPNPAAWDIQLTASDIDQHALDVARRAVYGEWSFRDCPPEMQTRYFTPFEDRWQVIDAVRNMVRFTRLNLAEDRFPWSASADRVDLIVCRFVTIYFGHVARQRLYQRFGDVLQPAGWLLLGPSDPVPDSDSGFKVQVLSQALAWRTQQRASPPAPLSRSAPHIRWIDSGGHSNDLARTLAAPTLAGRVSIDAQDYLNAGMLQLDRGAAAGAIDTLRRAAFLDATSALIQFCLGRAYRKHGDVRQSRSAFAHARRLLAGVDDDQRLADGDAGTGQLRVAVEAQLADLERTGR